MTAKMIAFRMGGHCKLLRKVGGISQFLTFVQPQVLAAPRILTLRRCFAGFDVENLRDYQVTSSSNQNLQRSLQYTQLFQSGSRREVSTSCNPLKVEIKPEQNGDRLIYTGPLTKMVTAVKFFSLSTSMISTGLIYALFMSNQGGGVLTYVAGGFSSIMILTPFLLHWFTKGYITQMHYNHSSNTYTACTFNFFLIEKKTEFKQSDVSLPTVSQAISSFSILGKPVLVDPRGFINPNHYSALMGYTDSEGNVKWEKETNSEEVK